MPVIPLILSGGSGTRLWPLSRASKPKQFLAFGRERSLFQETLLRCRAGVFDARPIVVGAADHRFLIADDCRAAEVDADILLEPVARNSCAAITAGCLQAVARRADAMVLALAADHVVPDTRAFAAAVAAARADAAEGRLVTFGVRPDRPSAAYGYIAPGRRLAAAAEVEAFVEKPAAEVAAGYVAAGYLWNSGNFLFRAEAFLDELRRLAPAILDAVAASFAAKETDLGFLRLAAEPFAAAPAISVDYAVMERTARAAVLPVDYAWRDVGSWDAVAEVLDPGADGNTIVGDGMVVDGARNIVHSEGRLAALIGADDMVVVSTRDCILVAPKARAEDVKALVARLDAAGRSEPSEAPRTSRPWGNYERLDAGDGYQVKRIVVRPGGELSLQKHRRRAEHWVVVQGTPEVTIDGRVRTLMPNQSIYVPLGSTHRLANRTAEPVVLIEVQTGDYLGEDDVIRLEDSYNRPARPGGD